MIAFVVLLNAIEVSRILLLSSTTTYPASPFPNAPSSYGIPSPPSLTSALNVPVIAFSVAPALSPLDGNVSFSLIAPVPNALVTF